MDSLEILGKYIKAVHLKIFEETDRAGVLHHFGDDLFKGEVDYKALFPESGCPTRFFCRLPVRSGLHIS